VPTQTLSAVVDRATSDRRLLDHPYYRSWQAGSLTQGDLAAYAEQYRYFETTLPEVLLAAAQATSDDTARALMESNLDDELSTPAPHLQLFVDFAAALGARPEAQPTAATSQLVGLYRQAADKGPIPALSVVSAYETQASQIAATKADALRQHHHLTWQQTKFWDVHAEIEQTHAWWTLDALQSMKANPQRVEAWAKRSADAWWEFLNEREAARGRLCSTQRLQDYPGS
jgi:pyrroloquinoline quinone (PQQ) biosynthesis protein C